MKEKEDTDGEEESERMQMSIEDDARTILRLSAQEKTLRQTSLQYMQTFGQFQSRLQVHAEKPSCFWVDLILHYLIVAFS